MGSESSLTFRFSSISTFQLGQDDHRINSCNWSPLKTLFPNRHSSEKLTESSAFQMRAPFPLAGQAPGSNLASEESLMSISILFRTRAGDDVLIESYDRDDGGHAKDYTLPTS